ncbi:MAG: phage tail tape measure protein, partial [Wohlfahrtiimonas sp.]
MAMYEIGFRISSAVGGALSGIKNVGNAITELNQKVEKTNQQVVKFGDKQSQFGGQLAKETAIVGAGFAALAYPAMEFETGMAGVKKVVDFDTVEDFKAFGNELLAMTRYLPTNAKGLTDIAGAGGQMGLARKELVPFTDTVAKMGIAFDITAEKAGDLGATLSNIYKIPIPELSNIGDAVNALSNVS